MTTIKGLMLELSVEEPGGNLIYSIIYVAGGTGTSHGQSSYLNSSEPQFSQMSFHFSTGAVAALPK